MEKTDIKSLTLEELSGQLKEMGLKAFRAKQIYQWLHEKLVESFDEMTNLSLGDRERLKERYRLTVLKPVEVLTSKIDGTRKYLFSLGDGNVIESVWMKYKHGNSVCISSQVGCRMGCRFCASTLDGLERNLLPSEMLDQIYRIQRDTGERVSNVVVMGSGEPLDNYDQVVRFLRLLNAPQGLNISLRNVSLSTCGLVEGIRRLEGEHLPVTLSISLHAPNDEIRRQIMPVARTYPIAQLMEAVRAYVAGTGRRVVFEYALIDGLNSRPAHARELARLLRGLQCHVNLIPLNHVDERRLRPATPDAVRAFQQTLEAEHISATVRREMGADIGGACGQLRRSRLRAQA